MINASYLAGFDIPSASKNKSSLLNKLYGPKVVWLRTYKRCIELQNKRIAIFL